jgi:serine phosphatase RsbU (regulator of sigma subunit)
LAYHVPCYNKMGTSPSVEVDTGKGLGAPEDSPGSASLGGTSSSRWVSRWAGQSLLSVTSSPWWAFLVVILAIACVAYADSKVEEVSLGYLYILPLSFSAILLPRQVTYGLVAVCIFLHDLFGPPIVHIRGRILHNLSAFVGFLFVVIILQRFVQQRNSLNEVTRHQRDSLLKEVELAAEVQRMFLPSSDPDTACFEIAGTMHPARVVGGDYYDYIARPDGSFRLVIADVSGKGAAAALLMSATAAAVRVETNETRNLYEVAKHLNDELYGSQDDGLFVTVILGELDPQSRRLKYINCGHNPALLLRRERSDVAWLQSSCMPVGLSPELNCTLEEIALGPSDILVWYTDGVTEARDKEGREYFGTNRILDVVREHSGGTARQICDQLYRAVADFAQRDSLDDDLTVMVLKLKENPDCHSSPPFFD